MAKPVLKRESGSLLTACNQGHLPRLMYKLMQMVESQEDDTYTLYVLEMGFYRKCGFLFGAHSHPFLRRRGGVCRLHAYLCYRSVKTGFKQGSHGDSKELLWDPMKQN